MLVWAPRDGVRSDLGGGFLSLEITMRAGSSSACGVCAVVQGCARSASVGEAVGRVEGWPVPPGNPQRGLCYRPPAHYQHYQPTISRGDANGTLVPTYSPRAARGWRLGAINGVCIPQ